MIKKVKEDVRCDIGTRRIHSVKKWWIRCRLDRHDKNTSVKKN